MALEKTLEHFQRERQRLIDYYRRELAELDEAISEVRLFMNHNGAAPVPHLSGEGSTEVRPGQWQGLKIADALRSYLNQKQGGAKVEPEVLETLLLAGVDLGRKERQARNIRIAIRSNRDKFKYDRKADWVELIAQTTSESDSRQP